MGDLSRISKRIDLLITIGTGLRGEGVEFGAGAHPFPVGAAAKVRFADRASTAELTEREYFGTSALVPIDFVADFETMQGVPLDSADFIIGSHVIEHTTNPLLALRSAYQRLRLGGRLVLVVPDKVATFDKNRDVTPLEHLVADYARPSRGRDFTHYVDFYTNAFPEPDPVKAAQGPFEAGHDIHFHVWTYESFAELVEYARRTIAPWSGVWSRERMSDQDNEFYFILTK